jgi:hypothetical protein
MVVGSVALIMINTLIFGFVQWLPTFFVQQGLSITKSFEGGAHGQGGSFCQRSIQNDPFVRLTCGPAYPA